LFRYFGLWFGLSAFFVQSGGACPFCGQPACPMGIGAAAAGGGIVTFFVHLITGSFHKNRKKSKPETEPAAYGKVPDKREL